MLPPYLFEEGQERPQMLQFGWYTIIYEVWIRSLGFEENKCNNLDPTRYIYPWLEYKVYDLIVDTTVIGYLLNEWDKDQERESLESIQLSPYTRD